MVPRCNITSKKYAEPPASTKKILYCAEMPKNCLQAENFGDSLDNS